MMRPLPAPFVETIEHLRFQAFCEACRQHRVLGLCYGESGVGKTLSSRHYANWDKVSCYSRYKSSRGIRLSDVLGSNIVFYTVPVGGMPTTSIFGWRQHLREFLIEDLYRQQDARWQELRAQEENEVQALREKSHTTFAMFQEISHRTIEAMRQLSKEFLLKQEETKDPTELLIVDECDRLTMAGLRNIIASYSDGGIGMVLLGMPRFHEKVLRDERIRRRIALVQQFRALTREELCQLLKDKWWPATTPRPERGITVAQTIDALIAMTGGNFRQCSRLLEQIGHIVEVTGRKKVTHKVFNAARENLVMVFDKGGPPSC